VEKPDAPTICHRLRFAREVVAQALDYAKEMSTWSYDDLEQAVKKAANTTLVSLAEEKAEELTRRDSSTLWLATCRQADSSSSWSETESAKKSSRWLRSFSRHPTCTSLSDS
jgi:hypothetical protein